MKAFPQKISTALLISLMLLTSGCVYYRLYQVRKQLGKFNENFQVVQDDGPTIISKNPVTLPSDLVWLLQMEPTRWQEGERLRVGQYHLKKIYPSAEADEDGAFDILAETRYEHTSGRLKEFHLPPRYSKVVNEEILVPMFARINAGKLKHGEESHSWNMGFGIEFPPMGSILELAGTPYREDKDETTHILHYRYHLEDGEPDDAQVDVEGSLAFRRSDYRIVRADFRVGSLYVRGQRKPEGGFNVKMWRNRG